MKKEMELVTSCENQVAVTGYFEDTELEKVKAFIESLGYSCDITESNKRFKSNYNPYRKISIRDINWNDFNVIKRIIQMKLAGKSYEDINTALGTESQLAVHMRLPDILAEYAKYQALDGKALTEEQLDEICKKIANRYELKDSQIITKIKKMIKNGCNINKNEFPECKNGFHKECFTCPFNMGKNKTIVDKIQLERFNKVFDTEF